MVYTNLLRYNFREIAHLLNNEPNITRLNSHFELICRMDARNWFRFFQWLEDLPPATQYWSR